MRSFLAFLSAEVVVAVDVVVGVAVGVAVGIAVGIAVGVFFAPASLVDLITNSDFVGAGLGSRWMLPMMSMSSLGKAGVCLASVASGLVHLVFCWLPALWLVRCLVRWLVL